MTSDDLYFKWDHKGDPDNLKSAVAIGDELIMSQFAVDDFTVNEITASYVTGILSQSYFFLHSMNTHCTLLDFAHIGLFHKLILGITSPRMRSQAIPSLPSSIFSRLGATSAIFCNTLQANREIFSMIMSQFSLKSQ